MIRAKTSGFTLIELLVATAVFSIGIGGMSVFMLSAARGMSEAEHESLANVHAEAMVATLMMSPFAMEHLAIPPDSGALCFENEHCSNRDFLIGEYLTWRSRVANQLPGGMGIVCRDSTPFDGDAASHECDASGPPAGKVFWIEPKNTNDSDGGHRRAVIQLPR